MSNDAAPLLECRYRRALEEDGEITDASPLRQAGLLLEEMGRLEEAVVSEQGAYVSASDLCSVLKASVAWFMFCLPRRMSSLLRHD